MSRDVGIKTVRVVRPERIDTAFGWRWRERITEYRWWLNATKGWRKMTTRTITTPASLATRSPLRASTEITWAPQAKEFS